MTHETFLNMFVPIIVAFVAGSYGYTFTVSRNNANKKDIEDLRTRINFLYESLVGKALNLDDQKQSKPQEHSSQ